jgi:hypothetical protein
LSVSKTRLRLGVRTRIMYENMVHIYKIKESLFVCSFLRVKHKKKFFRDLCVKENICFP